MTNPFTNPLFSQHMDSNNRSRGSATNPFQPQSLRPDIESSMLAEGGGAGTSLFSGPTAPASLGDSRPAGMRPARASHHGHHSQADIFSLLSSPPSNAPNSMRNRFSIGAGSASQSRPGLMSYEGSQTPPQGDGRASPSGSLSAADNTMVGATAAPPSAHKSKAKEQVMNSTLMFRAPLPVATVTVHGSDFAVHAELLCRESDYFRSCLRGGFSEAETQTITIDDESITVDDFGLWVDLLYRVHFNKPGAFVLRKEETGGTLSTMQLLTLWKLSDRFLNKPLASIVYESLQHRLGLYSVEQWRKLYRTRPTQDIKSRVSRLQDAYRYCCEQSLPFADAIVNACANCPPQVYDSSVAILDKEFMEQVSRRMIMAHADSTLLSKEQRSASLSMGSDHVMGGTSGAGGGGGGGGGSGGGTSRIGGVGSGAAAGRAAGGIGSL